MARAAAETQPRPCVGSAWSLARGLGLTAYAPDPHLGIICGEDLSRWSGARLTLPMLHHVRFPMLHYYGCSDWGSESVNEALAPSQEAVTGATRPVSRGLAICARVDSTMSQDMNVCKLRASRSNIGLLGLHQCGAACRMS